LNHFPNLFSVSFVYSFFYYQVSPDVEVVGSRNFSDKVAEMTKKSAVLYNSRLDQIGSSRASPVQHLSKKSESILPRYATHAPRRFLTPGQLFRADYVAEKSNFCNVSKSEVENYKVLCKLACSEYQLFWLLLIIGVFALQLLLHLLLPAISSSSPLYSDERLLQFLSFDWV
jgi:hypothetical protein